MKDEGEPDGYNGSEDGNRWNLEINCRWIKPISQLMVRIWGSGTGRNPELFSFLLLEPTG